MIEELRAVVGGNGKDLEILEESLGHPCNFRRPFPLEEASYDEAGLAFDEDEEGPTSAPGFEEVHFPVSVVGTLADGRRSVTDGESVVSSDAGLARAAVVDAQVLAFTAVTEVVPEGAAVFVVPPDEVVDPLGGDAQVGVFHDDLIWAEVALKILDDELGEEAADLASGLGASPQGLIFGILGFVCLPGEGIALEFPRDRAGSAPEESGDGANGLSGLDVVGDVSTV